MNADPTEISVPARLSGLSALIAAIQEKATCFNLSADTEKKIHLVVEELFINTVKHGYGGNNDALVRVSLTSLRSGAVTLRYEDQAPPFDPTEFSPEFRSTAEGGFGLALIRGMSREMRYRRANGKNIVELDFDDKAAAQP